jgi:arsenate reductase-like glutaredoxin family protein
MNLMRLDEVLTADMLAAKQEHIHDFLVQEGIPPHATDLGKTTLTERQIKELLAELAHDIHS